MMETGPLARLVLGYHKRMPQYREPADAFLKEMHLPFDAFFSTLGRHAARALECGFTARLMVKYTDDLIANIKAGDEAAANMEKWDPKTWPESARGVGLCEAPRGALLRHRKGPHCQLAGGRPHDLERFAPRQCGAARRLREFPSRNAARRSQTPLGNHPHDSQFRPVSRVCDARLFAGKQRTCGRLRAIKGGIYENRSSHL